MKPKLFVVQPIPEPALDILREVAELSVYPYLDRQISVDDLIGNARRADYLFVMHETMVTAEVIEQTPNIKGIGTMGANTALIDWDAARARKLPIVSSDPRTRILNRRVTADLTMALILNLAYRVVEADGYTRRGGFRQEQTLALMGIGCPGKTVGLIGLGEVARFLVPRVLAFDMQILYTKRTRLPEEAEGQLGITWAGGLDDLLRRSDFVCIECDYNPGTHKLIGERELALMKPSAFLINTARGRIVDEPALIRALQSKTIAGAGLDVYWHEPPETHDPHAPEELYKLDNVVITPHNGGATWESRGTIIESVAHSLAALIRGERPATLVNPEIYQ